jgi:Peptidase A4 family
MSSKGLGSLVILLVLAALPALAQVSGEPTSPLTTAAAITPREHGPMRLHRLVPGGAESENWSGYAVTGSSFTFAKGSWHVPEVDCTKTPNTYSAFWVGIDGWSDKTVEQTGTASDCSGTTAQYYAWYEFYPAGSVVISMPIKAGDVMGASVTYANGEFTVGIHNHTTGAEFHKTMAVSGAHRTSAEWIAEAPSNSSGSILPLADFDRANYGEDYAADPGTNYATDSAVNDGPIVDFGADVRAITMVSSGGTTEAVPTALTKDGTSFRVNWKAE